MQNTSQTNCGKSTKFEHRDWVDEDFMFVYFVLLLMTFPKAWKVTTLRSQVEQSSWPRRRECCREETWRRGSSSPVLIDCHSRLSCCWATQLRMSPFGEKKSNWSNICATRKETRQTVCFLSRWLKKKFSKKIDLGVLQPLKTKGKSKIIQQRTKYILNNRVNKCWLRTGSKLGIARQMPCNCCHRFTT